MKKGQYTEEKIVSILREAQQTENSGRPIQNGMVESLNENWFLNLDDARKQAEQFKKDYNTDREHSSLGRLTPAEFKAKIKQTPHVRWGETGGLVTARDAFTDRDTFYLIGPFIIFRYNLRLMNTMIPRELYLKKIRPFMNTPVVKVFTGIRRCGKSVLMELVPAELRRDGVTDLRMLSLNFESASDERVRSVEMVMEAVKTTRGAAGAERIYLFFDEI